MKIITTSLTGAALDWAVAECEGVKKGDNELWLSWIHGLWNPSEEWSQGGPIIERENINLVWIAGQPIRATIHRGGNVWIDAEGQTPLEAAMRCYVASKLGDEVEVPEELV